VSEYMAHFISAERFLRVIRTTWTKPRKQDSTPTIKKIKKWPEYWTWQEQWEQR